MLALGCLSRRQGLGRCVSLCVTVVTKELKQARGGVISEWWGSAACQRRLGRRRLVRGCARNAGTEERYRSFWGANGSAAAGSRQRGLCSGVQPLAPPPLRAVQATYLSAPAGGLPNLPAHSPAGCRFPRARGSWEAARKSPYALRFSFVRG